LGDVSPANTTARTVASDERTYDANAHFCSLVIFMIPSFHHANQYGCQS
jgi:hypothetical protein